MSEGSLPPFKLRLLRSSMRRTLARVSGFLRSGNADVPQANPPDSTPASDASPVIQSYAESHAALFERAERLREKADRLDQEGTPSDSASNRARRAEEEVERGLRELRSSYASNGDAEVRFDREVARRYPRLRLSGE